MSKRTRRLSAKQTDKYNIETAKILKAKGVISKQAKLHGGRYISRSVLKKAEAFRHVAFNVHTEPRPQYVALKVSKEFAKKAKAEGYQVAMGNRVIVPKEHDFIKRVRREAKLGKEGAASGIVPVKGGFKSEITIPFTANNSKALMEWLENGDLEERKLEHEMFMFTFHGSTSRRAFHSAKQMRQYLEHYNQAETLQALKIFRLHPEDQIKFIDEERVSVKRGNSQNRGRMNARGEHGSRSAARTAAYKQRMEYYRTQVPNVYAREMKKLQDKQADKQARLKANPKKYKASLAAGRARAKAWYVARKGGT